MQSWHQPPVGPVPDYVYSNSTPTTEMQSPQYQTEMARRNDRIDFPYGHPGSLPPNMAPQQQPQHHHPSTFAPQPPMNAPQQPPNGPASQQQTPTPTSAQTGRQRKRPAPNAAPSAGQGVAPAPASVPAQSQGLTPPAPQSAAPSAKPPAKSADDGNASSTAPPPAKKSRTNTPWTAEEESRLKQMRDQGKSWAEISKAFPNRTEGSVKKHYYKDMHWAEFIGEELEDLLTALKDYESNKWKVIGQKIGKPAKACEQHARENFPEMFGNPKTR